MAEAQEKDNTWIIIGVAIASIILLVLLLKTDETKHLQSGTVASSNAEVDAKLAKRHKNEFNNPGPTNLDTKQISN